MLERINYIAFLLIVSLLYSCTSHSPNDNVIVSVADAELRMSDLCAMVPQNISSKDSVAFADEYIHRWIQQQVVLQKAKQNLLDEELNINAAIEEYRTSLIIEAYQQKLLKQKFNAEIADTAISNYYEEKKQNFKLNESIVKGLFAIIPQRTKGIKDFEKSLKKINDDDFLTIEQFVFKNSIKYEIFFDKWIPLSSLLKYIPTNIQGKNLQNIKVESLVVLSDESNYYYLLPTDYRSGDDYAPLEYVSDKIHMILMNKEKIKFIKKVNYDLYNEALRNNKIQYHVE